MHLAHRSLAFIYKLLDHVERDSRLCAILCLESVDAKNCKRPFFIYEIHLRFFATISFDKSIEPSSRHGAYIASPKYAPWMNRMVRVLSDLICSWKLFQDVKIPYVIMVIA